MRKRDWILGIVIGVILSALISLPLVPRAEAQSLGIDSNVTFDYGPTAVAGDSTLHLVATIPANGKSVRLQGTVGANALTGLTIKDTAVHAGTASVLAADTDFATPTNPGVAYSRPSAPHTTAASGTFDLLLTAKSSDYLIYAKASSATTLRVVGTVLPN